jgi:hypothetical protein
MLLIAATDLAHMAHICVTARNVVLGQGPGCMGVRTMEILLVIAAWFGLAGVFAAGWTRFFRKVGPVPLPHSMKDAPPRPEERKEGQQDIA